VDLIHVLELLVDRNIDVYEKNRIRRNLEKFKPITISKHKSGTMDFFKLIMSFSDPKPRKIEKDLKAFSWSILNDAVIKILQKFYNNNYREGPLFTNSVCLPPSRISDESSDNFNSNEISNLQDNLDMSSCESLNDLSPSWSSLSPNSQADVHSDMYDSTISNIIVDHKNIQDLWINTNPVHFPKSGAIQREIKFKIDWTYSSQLAPKNHEDVINFDFSEYFISPKSAEVSAFA